MAVTVSLYNHTAKLLANKEVSFTSLKLQLLLTAASFTASHTSKTSVDNGSTSTVTITIASPGVVSWTAHGKNNGDVVVLRTTGALPTGLTAGTAYYIVNKATDTFQLSATSGGSAINTSGSQSGTHTATAVGSYDGGGNGWTPGGLAIANVAVTTVTTNDAMLDADDVNQTATGGTIPPSATATAALIYDWSTDKPIAYIDFGGGFQAGVNTQFQVVWSASGLLSFTY